MSSDHPEKESFASTACWIAAIRAHESERADRLFDDPWAALLVGQAGQAWLERMDLLQARLERISKDYSISMHWGKPGQEWGQPRLRFETTIPERSAQSTDGSRPLSNLERKAPTLAGGPIPSSLA